MDVDSVSASSAPNFADVSCAESACKFIADVIETPGVYLFDKFLSDAHIQALANDSTKEAYLRLLNLFAFGVYTDFSNAREQFPPLSTVALLKLRQLTLATLASQRSVVPYATLKDELELDSDRAVEEVFVSAKYAEICNGRLNCREGTVEFSEWLTRGVREMEVVEINELLDDWISRCAAVHGSLLDQLTKSEDEFKTQKEREAAVQAEIEKTKKAIASGPVLRDRSGSSAFREQKRDNGKRFLGSTGLFNRR